MSFRFLLYFPLLSLQASMTFVELILLTRKKQRVERAETGWTGYNRVDITPLKKYFMKNNQLIFSATPSRRMTLVHINTSKKSVSHLTDNSNSKLLNK